MFVSLLLSNSLALLACATTLSCHFGNVIAITWGLLCYLAFASLQVWRIKTAMIFVVSFAMPATLVLFLFAIELLSGKARVMSLSFRIFANVVAGHEVMELLSQPSCALEVCMALLQAFVFRSLLLIYAKESCHTVSCEMPLELTIVLCQG